MTPLGALSVFPCSGQDGTSTPLYWGRWETDYFQDAISRSAEIFDDQNQMHASQGIFCHPGDGGMEYGLKDDWSRT